MKVAHLRRLSVAHSLYPALVNVALGERLHLTVRCSNVDASPLRQDHFTVLDFGHRDWGGLRAGGDRRIPDIPGFSSLTVIGWPSTMNLKSSGTEISRVPSGSLTTSVFPSTESPVV
jgi:hypothetical protein